MPGWFADSLRFAWALLYWNTRKTWFRLRRGYARCPCQSPSDSGRALETGCDACFAWHRPERFRRVCPLLVRTPEGLRCSADTADVRPFWGVTIRYYGGALLALYVAGVLAVFGFLRTIGYPVSIIHVGLPPLWHRVGQARGWFFLARSQQAFAAGRTTEGLLYLQNGYEFDPRNYEAGIALAKAYQLSHPERADELFARLLRDHPGHRSQTAQYWYRALLARGEFAQITLLASDQVIRDNRLANVWMRALLFAVRQVGDATPLRQLLENRSPVASMWHRVLSAELLLRAGNRVQCRAELDRSWPADSPAFSVVYRVETLVTLGDPVEALDVLERERTRLDDEAWLTLRLHCLAASGSTEVLRGEFERFLLAPPLTQPILKVMCAQLIRHPDRMLFTRVAAKVSREGMPLRDDTAGGWFSLLCAAGASGDPAQLHALTLQLRQASPTPFAALLMVEAFFRGELADPRATSFLPVLPVPIEVTYALIERYPGNRTATVNRVTRQ